MPRGSAAIIGLFGRCILILALPGCLAGLSQREVLAQASGVPTLLPRLRLPVAVEWSESLDPRASQKLATQAFSFQGGTKDLKIKLSTQAPGILGGKQFQWMPGGYQLSEISLSRKWGSIQGFRSLRYNSQIVRPENARTISGAGVEIPKTLLGASLSAYFLHASPSKEARLSQGNALAGSAGSQIGFALVRRLKRGARLQAEWSQTQHESRPLAAKPGESLGGARRGLMMSIEGVLARTDLNLTLTTRGEGLANPSSPTYNPGRRNLRLDARRKFGGHQFQYSGQSDAQRGSLCWGFIVSDVQEHIAGWSYAARRLPQFSASQTWRRQVVGGRAEEERNYRLSAAKSVRRMNASVALLRARRTDLLSAGLLWQHTVLVGDASIEIRKGRQLHLRYETGRLRHPILQQELEVSSLRLDTRLNMWRENLILAPVLDIRAQGGNSPASAQTASRFGMSSRIKVPRWMPGTDFVVNLAVSQVRSAGRPDWSRVDLTMLWNFSRF